MAKIKGVGANQPTASSQSGDLAAFKLKLHHHKELTAFQIGELQTTLKVCQESLNAFRSEMMAEFRALKESHVAAVETIVATPLKFVSIPPVGCSTALEGFQDSSASTQDMVSSSLSSQGGKSPPYVSAPPRPPDPLHLNLYSAQPRQPPLPPIHMAKIQSSEPKSCSPLQPQPTTKLSKPRIKQASGETILVTGGVKKHNKPLMCKPSFKTAIVPCLLDNTVSAQVNNTQASFCSGPTSGEDGREGHALHLLDEMPKSKWLGSARNADSALTSIRDKGGGYAIGVNHAEENEGPAALQQSVPATSPMGMLQLHTMELVVCTGKRLKQCIEGSRKIRQHALQPCFSGFDKKVRDKGSGHPLITDEHLSLPFTDKLEKWKRNARLLCRKRIFYCMYEDTDNSNQRIEWVFEKKKCYKDIGYEFTDENTNVSMHEKRLSYFVTAPVIVKVGFRFFTEMHHFSLTTANFSVGIETISSEWGFQTQQPGQLLMLMRCSADPLLSRDHDIFCMRNINAPEQIMKVLAAAPSDQAMNELFTNIRMHDCSLDPQSLTLGFELLFASMSFTKVACMEMFGYILNQGMNHNNMIALGALNQSYKLYDLVIKFSLQLNHAQACAVLSNYGNGDVYKPGAINQLAILSTQVLMITFEDKLSCKWSLEPQLSKIALLTCRYESDISRNNNVVVLLPLSLSVWLQWFPQIILDNEITPAILLCVFAINLGKGQRYQITLGMAALKLCPLYVFVVHSSSTGGLAFASLLSRMPLKKHESALLHILVEREGNLTVVLASSIEKDCRGCMKNGTKTLLDKRKPSHRKATVKTEKVQAKLYIIIHTEVINAEELGRKTRLTKLIHYLMKLGKSFMLDPGDDHSFLATNQLATSGLSPPYVVGDINSCITCMLVAGEVYKPISIDQFYVWSEPVVMIISEDYLWTISHQPTDNILTGVDIVATCAIIISAMVLLGTCAQLLSYCKSRIKEDLRECAQVFEIKSQTESMDYSVSLPQEKRCSSSIIYEVSCIVGYVVNLQEKQLYALINDTCLVGNLGDGAWTPARLLTATVQVFQAWLFAGKAFSLLTSLILGTLFMSVTNLRQVCFAGGSYVMNQESSSAEYPKP